MSAGLPSARRLSPQQSQSQSQSQSPRRGGGAFGGGAPVQPTVLYSTKRDVESENRRKLSGCPAETAVTFAAKDSVEPRMG